MKKFLSLTLCFAILMGLVPGIFVPGKASAISDFGVVPIGGPPKLGTFVSPSWLASEGNRVYVVEQAAFRTQAIMKNGQSQFAFGLHGNHEEQISDPGGIFAYREKIYWIDRSQGKILVRGNKVDSPYEGEFTPFGTDGRKLLKRPEGIWIDQNRIYIANSGASNVVVLDLNGKFINTIGSKGIEDGKLSSPAGVCVVASKLFVTDPQNGRIVIYDLDGKFIQNISSSHPFGITALESKIFVTDAVEGKITILNADGATVSSFGSPGSGQGQLGNPIGITILDGKIYVASNTNNRVDVFEQDGKYAGILGLPVEQAASSFGRPAGVAYNGENIAVADFARKKVIIMTKDGKFISEFGSFGTGERQFANPVGVDYKNDNIYVADAGNNCIKQFTVDGTFKKIIGSAGNGNGKLNSPSDVVVVSSVNKMFVADSGNNLVQVFSLSGEFINQFGGYGQAPGQFSNPTGISSDGRKLIVADSGNCRIQEFTLDGKPVKQYGFKGRGKEQLFFPQDCSYDQSGKIYVSDTYNDRVVVFDNASGRSWIYGRSGGPGRAIFFSKSGEENEDTNDPDIKKAAGFFSFPSGLACIEDKVIVSDTQNLRLQSVPYSAIFDFPRVDTESFVPQTSNVVWFTVAPKILDFGVMPVGEQGQRRIEVRNWTGGALTGKIEISQEIPFLSVDPPTFVGDVNFITVKIDTTGMTAGQAMKAVIKIATNKGDQSIEAVVLPSDGFGYSLPTEQGYFVEMECNNPASLEITINPQNGFDRNVSFSYAMPLKKCLTHPSGKAIENLSCDPKNFELSNVTVEFKPSSVKIRENNKTTMTLIPKGNVTPGIYEIAVTMNGAGAANKEVKFTFILLVNPCTNPATDKQVPRALLTETFTAVWCQYCPFHREGQYRMAEEYGYAEIIPLAYYCDAPNDNSGMTQESHHYRYRWYTQEGLPTTMFNGVWNFSEGDKPFERQAPPPDRLPDRKMSGTSFSYLRFKQRTETYRHMTSPLSLFLQATVDGDEGDAYLEINTLSDVSAYKDLNVYFVLVENNVLFEATNGEREHSLTVMKFLYEKGQKKSPKDEALGDPISLAPGTITKRRIHFEMPGKNYDWKTLTKNCYVVAWIQDNTKKEILQSTMVDLAQPLLTSYTFKQVNGQQTSVQAGSRANFKYILTNTGNIFMDFGIQMTHLGGQNWENSLLVDKVPSPNGGRITLDPMQSSLIELSVEVPPGTSEGTESLFRVEVSDDLSGQSSSSDLKLMVEPAKPPSFEISSSTKFVEVEPSTETSFNLTINPINEYNNPVTLQLAQESQKYFQAKFDPPNGVPPFETKVTIKSSEQLEYFEDGYKIKILATGSDARGEKIEKDITIRATAKLLSLTLKPERKVITSCAINEICRQTEVKINLEPSDIQLKEARLDFVYDGRYLEVTNVSLGQMMTRFGEIADMQYDIKPDRVNIRIKREKGVVADQNENTIVAITLKSTGDKIEIDNVRIGLENVTLLSASGSKALTKSVDETLSIRKNAKPPVIHLITPIQKDSPWPDEAESKRRSEQGQINYRDITTTEKSLKISGKCESEEGVKQLTLFVGGNKVQLASDGTFDYTMNLKEGFNNIVIVCQNFTGESDGIMVIAVLDTTPPDLIIDRPSEDQLSMDYSMTTGQNFVEFRGFTEEKAKVTVAGRQVQVRKDPITDDETKRFFFTEKVQLAQGLNEIEVSACDENGNCRQYTYKVTYDPKAGNGKTTKIELWLGKASMLVNGETVKLVTAPTASSPPLPKDLAGSTFMPIAEVAKALDVEVGWNGKDKKVTLTQKLDNGKKKVIELWIGKKTAKIDGKEVFIDSAKKLYPTIVSGKTLLPLRFVGDALGALVEYESKAKKITLTYPKP